MARRDIDIGTEGNDGTGDSIRESFRKSNENFRELYAFAGQGGDISFTALSDTPNSYTGQANHIPVVNSTENSLEFFELVSDDLGFAYDSGSLTITVESITVSKDDRPRLGGPLDGRSQFAIGDIAISQQAVDIFNARHNKAITIDDLVIDKKFADKAYQARTSATGAGVRIGDEPATVDSYTKSTNTISSNNLIIPSHGYGETYSGTLVVFDSSGDDPLNLISGNEYYIGIRSQNEIGLYNSALDAIQGSNQIQTSGGSGTFTITDAGYDDSLEGNWLSDVALPRKSIVRRQGDTMTGFLTLSADPTNPLHAATKQYVDLQTETVDTLEEMNDTEFESLSNGDIIIYNGSSWKNYALSTNSTESDISVGFSGATASLQINSGSIVDADISSLASIAQSKLNLLDASTSSKGIASFNNSHFDVVAGAVSAKNITVGSTSVELGETAMSLSGLQTVSISNLTINTNEISSTDTNGNIILNPNGIGSVDVSSSKIVNVSDPAANQDAATKKYVDDQISTATGGVVTNINLLFDGDTGADSLNLATDTLTFVGGSGLNTAVTDNQVTFDLETATSDTTGVTLDKLSHILQNRVLARTDSGVGAVTEVDFSTVLTQGGGLVDDDFTGTVSVTGEVLIKTGAQSYGISNVTITGEPDSVVKTTDSGKIHVKGLVVGDVDTYEVLTVNGTVLELKTPDGAVILTADENPAQLTVPTAINSSDIIPRDNNIYNLGADTNRYENVYANNINATGTTTLGSLLFIGNGIDTEDSSAITVTPEVFLQSDLTVENNFTVKNNVELGGDMIPDIDNIRNIGSEFVQFDNVYAVTFNGTATALQGADLAENYLGDNIYEPGTVMIFGGEYEVTVTDQKMDHRVAGVVTTNPAQLMNSHLKGDNVIGIALQGRVPCKVIGVVQKGDILITSAVPGYAVVDNNATAGRIIGKSLDNKRDTNRGIIEVVVGKH